MTRPIVILGIFVADTTFRAARLPRMGETILGQGFALGPGGKGSNQAVAAALAGAGAGAGAGGATAAGVKAHFITRLGADDFAAIARTTWARAGVIPEVTEDAQSFTGAAMIFVDATSGDNAIIVTPGAAGRISAADVEAKAGLIRGAAVFVTQFEQPLAAARRGLEIARAAGVTTVLNPAPAAPADDALLSLCDWITPNESEAEALSGIAVTGPAAAERAARALMGRGAGAVVVTLGAGGALLCSRDGSHHVPAFDAGPVAETTGAGDAFNGAFAVALAEGRDALEAVRFGCAAAAISVTRRGAATSMPARAAIEALLARG